MYSIFLLSISKPKFDLNFQNKCYTSSSHSVQQCRQINMQLGYHWCIYIVFFVISMPIDFCNLPLRCDFMLCYFQFVLNHMSFKFDHFPFAKCCIPLLFMLHLASITYFVLRPNASSSYRFVLAKSFMPVLPRLL